MIGWFCELKNKFTRGTKQTNQNEDVKFVLPFTKPTIREQRNEVSLLTDARMTRPENSVSSQFSNKSQVSFFLYDFISLLYTH